jgi:peroxiredoxin
MSRLPKLTRSWLLWGSLLAGLLVGLVGANAAMALEVGEKAPDFTLPGTTGEKISLSQFRGRMAVLIEFYGGESPTCGKNLSARKVDHGTFRDLNVQTLGISADHTFAQKTFAESLQLPYPLLSDFPDLQAIRNYGVLWPLQIGPKKDGDVVIEHRPNTAARRAFFLVDQQGIVRGKWLVENNAFFPSEGMLKVAREITGNQ